MKRTGLNKAVLIGLVLLAFFGCGDQDESPPEVNNNEANNATGTPPQVIESCDELEPNVSLGEAWGALHGCGFEEIPCASCIKEEAASSDNEIAIYRQRQDPCRWELVTTSVVTGPEDASAKVRQALDQCAALGD